MGRIDVDDRPGWREPDHAAGDLCCWWRFHAVNHHVARHEDQQTEYDHHDPADGKYPVAHSRLGFEVPIVRARDVRHASMTSLPGHLDYATRQPSYSRWAPEPPDHRDCPERSSADTTL